MKTQFLITCEHAVNDIPEEYRDLFSAHQDLLNTHRGFDIGALQLYNHCIERIPCQHKRAEWSRLIIDLNRSLHHPNLFSEVTKPLPLSEKNKIIDRYYKPYRTEVLQWIKNVIKKRYRVIHISIHSFTPHLNHSIRKNDVGFLYDPRRQDEKKFCLQWKKSILEKAPHYQIRMNYPYRGHSDGFTTALRRSYSEKQYLGIELEINQKHFQNNQSADLVQTIVTTVQY